MLLQEGALTARFRARFGFETTEPITVRFIRMSEELQEGLDYPSKLSRHPAHIDRLVADGEAQASAFLARSRSVERRRTRRRAMRPTARRPHRGRDGSRDRGARRTRALCGLVALAARRGSCRRLVSPSAIARRTPVADSESAPGPAAPVEP